jgi:hypothetical protein
MGQARLIVKSCMTGLLAAEYFFMASGNPPGGPGWDDFFTVGGVVLGVAVVITTSVLLVRADSALGMGETGWLVGLWLLGFLLAMVLLMAISISSSS